MHLARVLGERRMDAYLRARFEQAGAVSHYSLAAVAKESEMEPADMTAIYLDVEQGSQAWLEARAGIPTASNFARILTPAKLQASEQRHDYTDELIGEWALGVDADDVWTDAMERGKVLEPEAFDYYRFHVDAEPKKCGLVYRDESRTAAASPDGKVVDDGILELKCPSARVHLGYLRRGILPTKYAMQVQGQLWVSGRTWCDFMSYHPGLPPLIVREYPEARYQDALDKMMPQFIAELLEGRERLRAMGVHPETEEES